MFNQSIQSISDYLFFKTVWETTARQLAKTECKAILVSISIQVLAILVSSHV
jgi:hypothetical protein